jgi:hypothetical protein
MIPKFFGSPAKYYVTLKKGWKPIDGRLFSTKAVAEAFKEELEGMNARKEFLVREIQE